jgi:hypothetical protein
VTTPAEFAARMKSAGKAPARSPHPREASRPEAAELPAPHLIPETVPMRKINPARRDLSASLPPHTALLKVVRARHGDRDAFQLEGYFGNKVWVSDPKDLRYQLQPGMMLSRELNHTATIDTAVKCYRYMLNWSAGKHALKNWIAMLRAAMGSEVRLVIWDDTDFGIPWELFQLHPTGGADTEWLGAVVKTIRWTTVHDPARSDQFSALMTENSEGGILYYEDAGLVADLKYSFGAQEQPGLVPKNDMKDLLAELADKSKKYGLVYVRAHGVHGDSLDTATLAGVRLGDFEGYALPVLKESRAVVFLNACNSATNVCDAYYADGLNRNFAEVFLRQHASAVIATLAEVPVRSSWGLANTLLQRAYGEGVNVPEFLRHRRAVYFGEVRRLVHSKGIPSNGESLTREQKAAIQGFMYVSVFAYFGHPDAMLRLGA